MIHIEKIAKARQLVNATPNAKIRLWVDSLDCFVGITKAEMNRISIGGMAVEHWEIEIRYDFFGDTFVYINPTNR